MKERQELFNVYTLEDGMSDLDNQELDSGYTEDTKPKKVQFNTKMTREDFERFCKFQNRLNKKVNLPFEKKLTRTDLLLAMLEIMEYHEQSVVKHIREKMTNPRVNS
jgi:hypothetical protein